MNEPDERTDAYLMGLIANGDPEGVRPLIERYQKPLFSVLRRALRHAEDVEDVAQETWMRVVRSARSYDPEQRFTSWLFAIAWNRVRDRWRRVAPTADADLQTMPSAGRSAEEETIDRDRDERVRALVATLPPKLSEAIFLRYFEELSEREIAMQLGVPVGTVKSRIHSALNRLALTLTEEG